MADCHVFGHFLPRKGGYGAPGVIFDRMFSILLSSIDSHCKWGMNAYRIVVNDMITRDFLSRSPVFFLAYWTIYVVWEDIEQIHYSP